MSRLDIKLRTPTPTAMNEATWQSKTSQNVREIELQATLVRNRILYNQNSPTSNTEHLKIHEPASRVL